MIKNDMTAAQRIMLSKGQDFYIPKSPSISISPKNELILFAIMLLGMTTYFFSILSQNIFGNNTDYATTLCIFIYLFSSSFL